jgi:hypothetical protein
VHGDRTLIKLLILQANCVDRRAGHLAGRCCFDGCGARRAWRGPDRQTILDCHADKFPRVPGDLFGCDEDSKGFYRSAELIGDYPPVLRRRTDLMVRIPMSCDSQTKQCSYYNRTVHDSLRQAQKFLGKKINEIGAYIERDGAKISLGSIPRSMARAAWPGWG